MHGGMLTHAPNSRWTEARGPDPHWAQGILAKSNSFDLCVADESF